MFRTTVSVRPIEPQGKLIGFLRQRSILAVWSSTILRLWTRKNGIFLGAPLKTWNPCQPDGYRATVRIPDRATQERINAAGVEAYHAAVEQLVARAQAVRPAPIKEQMAEAAESKREKKTLPGLRLPRQRRPVMTDSRTLGQSVPKEGLFLMGMALAEPCPRT